MKNNLIIFHVLFFGFCGICGGITGDIGEAALCINALLFISYAYEVFKKNGLVA